MTKQEILDNINTADFIERTQNDEGVWGWTFDQPAFRERLGKFLDEYKQE